MKHMATKTISINRAPVLTLWAAVVAQRLGFNEDESGRTVMEGMNEQIRQLWPPSVVLFPALELPVAGRPVAVERTVEDGVSEARPKDEQGHD